MKVLLMPNFDKSHAIESINKIVEKLRSLSIGVLMGQQHETRGIRGVDYLEFYTALSSCDLIIAVGGDGTMLHCAKHALEVDKPLLGINVGRLGFMAGLEMSELFLLDVLVGGSYITQERMLLKCEHITSKKTERYYVLNDMVISKGTLSQIIDIDIYCNDKNIMNIRADGIVFATPTGSSAYSLSAGGPIVEPELDCIITTPICPHSLFNRTVIFKKTDVITVKVGELNRHSIYMTADGMQGDCFEENDTLKIMASEKKLRLVMLKDKSFYEILRSKLL